MGGVKMKIAKLVCGTLCLIVALAWGISTPAQTFERGEIRGTTFDQSHSAVPKVTVTLSNPSTGYKRSVDSDSDGIYTFAQVPPGVYTIMAELPNSNFGSVTIKDIELHVGASITLDITMPIKTQTTTVEVSASTAVEAPTAGISQLLNSQSVQNLPLLTNDYRDLAQLSPSAQVVPGLRGGIRLGGQQSDYSGLTIDGNDSYNNFFGEFFGSLETKNMTIPIDSVQEFQVVVNGFAPEFGRSTGGLINVVTKSGTNRVHGTFHYNYRGSGFEADDALHNPSPIARRNEFGGSVGFPIHKDKQFFFGAFDMQRQHGPLVTQFCTPGHNFTNCEAQIAATPLPPVYGAATLKDLEGAHNQFQNFANILGHYDWQITPANHFSVRGFWTRNHTSGFTGGRGQNEIQAGFDNTENFRNSGVNGVFALNTAKGNKVNEIRVGISGETRPRHSNSAGAPEVVFTDSNPDPNLSLNLAVDIGNRFFLPINGDNGKLQGQDNFGYSFGKHDMKWGGDVDVFTDRKDAFVGWSRGEFFFASLNDFKNNNADGFIQGFGLHGKTITQADTLLPNYQSALGLYWQDKWQATPKLSLTYGIRWDTTWNPQPQSLTSGSQVYVGQGDPGSSGGSHLIAPPQRVPNDLKQFGPRVGFAYNLGGVEHPTVVRAAWGLYYAQVPTIFLPTLGNDRGTTMFCCAIPTFPNIFNSSLTANSPAVQAQIGPPGINYVDPSFRNPRVSNVTVGVEHTLARDWTISAHYAYVHSIRLRVGGFSTTTWSRNVVVDHFDQFGRAILVPSPIFGPLPLDPTIGQANELGSFGHGNYHEFVAGVDKRFSHKYQFFATYTWSRNYDNASSERDTDTFYGPQDPFNLNLDYGRNGLDITHQFKAGGIADLPMGFQVSGTIIGHSGLAYPAYDVVDVNGDGVVNQFANNDRPTVTSGSRSFLLPRYPARQPDFFQWDMRLSKYFKFKENMRLQFLGDLFNLTNRGNLYSNPDNSAFVPDSLTGTPSPSSSYRRLDQISPGGTAFAAQFGVKFIF
jgi:carboxypeptidase family protein